MIRTTPAWVLTGLICLTLSPSTAAQGTLDEVKQSIDAYIGSYNAGSVDDVMQHWAEDADFVDIRGNLHQGRDLIAALFRRGFTANPGRSIRLHSDCRKQLANNVVMDDGILELFSPDGGSVRGRYAVIWSKKGDRWQIQSARDIPLESDENEEESDEPQRPSLEALSFLVGKWQATSDKYRISLDCQPTMDDTYLVQTFAIQSDEPTFTVVTYITFDPAQGAYRSWYFDSRGGFGGGLWSQEDGAWYVDIDAVVPNGQIGSSTMIWSPVDEHTLHWQATQREIEGEMLPDAEQNFVRAGN